MSHSRLFLAGGESTENKGIAVTETDWLVQINPLFLLMHLGEQATVDLRRLRLFGAACFRRIWDRIDQPAVRRMVELAEAHADGQVTATELASAEATGGFVELDARSEGPTESGPQISKFSHNLIQAVRWIASPKYDVWGAAMISDYAAGDVREDFFFDPTHDLRGSNITADDLELAEQVRLLRDIFGNPFRPVTFNPKWRTEHTVGIATKLYHERIFDAMPILADALEDAGCDSEEILSHCREPGVHVCGCWVVDLVLGKE